MPMIAVDWGSSSFRAWLLSNEGEVLADSCEGRGIFAHNGEGFAESLKSACTAWLAQYPDILIVMAGMVGSRAGWHEAAYAKAPLRVDALAEHLLPVADEDLNAFIIPGVSCQDNKGKPDVMRGEEVQIFGALELIDSEDALLVLPGTHSKWAKIQAGELQDFATFFTGELFALLQEKSSIAAVLGDPIQDDEAFLAGIKLSREQGGLLNHIFAPRALTMSNQWTQGSLFAFLSGIAIGHEIQGGLALYPDTRTLYLVGKSELQHHYALAAKVFDIETICLDAATASIAGIRATAGALSHSNQDLSC